MRRGGSTARFSSMVVDEEKGLRHLKSVNHSIARYWPLYVLFGCTGALCAEGPNGLSFSTEGRSGMEGTCGFLMWSTTSS